MTSADHTNTVREAKEQVRREYYDDGGTTFSGTPLSEIVEQAIERFIEVAALVAQAEAAEADNTRLREALTTALDCKGSYEGSVSIQGGSPAICPRCAAIARAALATDRTDPVDGLTDDERAHRRDNALNYGEIERLREALSIAIMAAGDDAPLALIESALTPTEDTP